MVVCDHKALAHRSPKNGLTFRRLAILLVCALLGGQAYADSPVRLLHGPTSERSLAGHIDYFIDSDWSLTPALAISDDAPEFLPLRGTNADFGYTSNRIWLRIRVQNGTDAEDEWLIYFPENFKQHFRVDVVSDDGTIARVLELEADSPFAARPVPYPEMVAPLTLAPGASATILVSLWSEGSSYISFSFETPKSFAALAGDRTAKNFAFYGMMTALIVAAFVALVLLRNGIFLAYCAYAGSGLLYVMQIDGVTFQYLWPNSPGINNSASVFAGAGIIIFGAIYSRMYLKTKRYHPVVDAVLLSIILITLGMIAILFFTDPQLLKQSLVVISLIAILTFAMAAFNAARTRYREVRFYLIAWIGLFASSFTLNLNHLFGLQLSQSFIYEGMRATMVFDSVMMGLAILDSYTQLRQSQSAAMEAQLRTFKRNLDLSERLAVLAENYKALEMKAKMRNEQIENTVHDLRQPLHALRLKVSDLIHDGPIKTVEPAEVNAAFAYLEDLVSDYLKEREYDDPSMDAYPADRLDLKQILESVKEMFAPDAAASAIGLTLHCQAVAVPVDPLAVMRILSNLVSNAVNYTNAGGVEINAIEENDAILITVKDTGPGMTQDEFTQALKRDIRLTDKSGLVEGHGLGLAIAHEIATTNNMALSLIPQTGGGTTIQLSIPLPKTANGQYPSLETGY